MAVTKKMKKSYKKEVFRETWSEVKSPKRPIGLLLANHKSINQIYILWRRKKNMWMESFKNPNSLMKNSNMKVLKMKILHKGL